MKKNGFIFLAIVATLNPLKLKTRRKGWLKMKYGVKKNEKEMTNDKVEILCKVISITTNAVIIRLDDIKEEGKENREKAKKDCLFFLRKLQESFARGEEISGIMEMTRIRSVVGRKREVKAVFQVIARKSKEIPEVQEKAIEIMRYLQ